MEIAQEVRGFLDGNGWDYSFDWDTGIFRFGVTLRGNLKTVQYTVGIDDDSYIVYAVSPLSADRDDTRQMIRMAEFVCRANYGLRDGNFEFDFRDGELRYKNFVNCDGMLPTFGILRDSLGVPAAMFSRYSKGILQIVLNNMSAKEAVELCERREREPEKKEESEGPVSQEEKADMIWRILCQMHGSEEDIPDADEPDDGEEDEYHRPDDDSDSENGDSDDGIDFDRF